MRSCGTALSGWRTRATLAGVTLLVSRAAVAVGPAPASAATVDPNAWYVLVNRNSGKALDV